MKTIVAFLAFLLCGFVLYPQTDSEKPSKNVVLGELQSKNASQPVDSVRQAANQQYLMGGADTDQRIQTQFVPLNQGWTGISSSLNPDNPAVAQMMAAIEQQLIILMDFKGNIYQPSIENTLVNWDFRQGYFIKMASAETLEIIGLEPLTKQIDLQTGWNLIPVLSEVEVDIEDYFFDNNDKIEIVTEAAGVKVFWPDKAIATLTQLIPGKAYLVKVKEPFSLFELPTITTTPISEITATSAISGGSVDEIGSSPITARGIVWNTDGNATIDFNQGITSDGQGTGEYVSILTGLSPSTFYYVRSYATNHVGTAYGEELVFVTLQDLFTCGEVFTDSRDGQQYPTVHIGNQCWMAANLNIGEMVSGNVDLLDNGIIEKHCYDNSLARCSEYGGLYQWDEVMEYTTVEGVQGICPEGWYFPTDAQWTILENFVGGYLVAGGKLKEAGTAHWLSPNVGATNSSGFTALGGGFLSFDRIFFNLKSTGVFWTSTAPPNEYPWPRILNHNLEVVYRVNYYPTTTSFSVRCVRDAPAQVNIPTVITTPVTAITSNSAASGGTVTEDGGALVTSRGIVWSSLQTPTVEVFDGITYDGNGAGEFTSVMTNLLTETTYFIRAYATNSEGTAYGDELSFTTQSLSFVCGNTFTDSRDGNQYSTVQIGNQCWFSENLAYLPAVSPPSEGSYEDPLYYVYGYNSYSTSEAIATQNYQTYGALYNWVASSTACPQGWYLPTDNDWKILEGFVDSQYGIGNPVWDFASWRGFDVGKNLKTIDGWYINSGTDLRGFSALPGGYRDLDGNFTSLSIGGVWWSSSPNSATTSWSRFLHGYYDESYRNNDNTDYGFSVRCLKNESQVNLPTVITTDVVNITGNSARCGGVVTSDGGAAVSSRGVVWNTTGYPTVDDNDGISFNGDGTGSFTSYLTYLFPETQYYVRAYATNSLGTSYGDQHFFETTYDFDDWNLHEVTLYNTAEAEIIHRTGDIDNLGFGWPMGFNPFSGEENPVHSFPFYPDLADPEGTDRIMVISGYNYNNGGSVDGYTVTTQRPDNLPQTISLQFDTQSVTVQSVVIQMFVDDFQRGVFGNNYFQVSINDVRIPILESIINSLDQTGPIGKLITVQIPESFINLFVDGEVNLFVDDPVNNVGDGFAIDFVRLLINPGSYQNTGTIYGTITDPNGYPVEGATVTASGVVTALTDEFGYYELLNVPAGLVYLSASKSGYYPESILVDLVNDTEVVQNFILQPAPILCEGLDNCDLSFSTGGDAPWFSQSIISFDSEDAVQTGEIEDNGQTWLETIVEGPGTLSFYCKVSSEYFYDYLNLYVGGELVFRLSGETLWNYEEFEIPEGFHAVTWIYEKNGSVSSGQDAGWLDQVQFNAK